VQPYCFGSGNHAQEQCELGKAFQLLVPKNPIHILLGEPFCTKNKYHLLCLYEESEKKKASSTGAGGRRGPQDIVKVK